MMKILNILLCLLLVSCVTHKSALKETATLATTQHNDMSQQTTKTESATSTLVVSDFSIVRDTTLTTLTTTKFSKPDSVGKQYPVEETKAVTKNWSKKENNIKAQATAKADQHEQTKKSDKSDYKSDGKETAQQTDETKTTTPLWLKGVVVVLSIALLFGVYVVLRRFGAITWVVGAIGRLLNKS
jgi:cobalamin biosynthesis Mg chelatase CobN